MRRKILSFLLVFCMVLTLLPASALATEVDGEQGNEPTAVSETENTQAGDEAPAAPAAEEQTKNVAQIGETGYTTLKAAFEAVSDSNAETITLTADATITECITIAANKDITLDIGGHNITVPSNATDLWKDGDVVAMFSVSGKLTIKGSGAITAKTNDSYVINVVGGTCVLEGTVTYTGNVSVVQVQTGTLTVTGGTFKLAQKAQTYNDSRYMLNCIDANYTNETAKIEVMGGTFENFDPGNNLAEGANTNFLAEGYTSTAGTDTPTVYTVTKATSGVTDVVAKIGSQEYESLSTAVSAASATDTIVLQKNVDISEPVNITKQVTLDLNGKTVGVASNATIWSGNNCAMFQVLGENAKLTIKGSGAITAKKDDSYVACVNGTGAECIFEGKATYTGNITVAHVWTGTITVKDGTFKLDQKDDTKPYAFMLNIQDANAQDGSGKIVVTGGVFYGVNPADTQSDPNDPTSYVAEGCVSTKTSEATGDTPAVWTVKAEQPLSLTIGNLETFPTESWWSDITKDKLVDGELVFTTEGQTVTVTGALKYAEWTAFNSEESGERAGHYLPLQIKLSDATRYSGQKVTIKGATEKVLNFSSDGSFELAMFLDKLDGKNDTTEGKFTITLGEGADAKVYTVDCTGLTLLPKAADGTTVGTTQDNNVEAKPKDDNSGTSVVIPSSVNGLDEMTVKVTNVSDKASLVPSNANLADGVADAIKGTGSKVVEVTVTKKGSNGSEEEQFTSGNTLQDKKITITIGGLNSGTTYYLFCITDSAVSFCGTTVASTTSIKFTTTHLCKWAVVAETDALKTANLGDADSDVDLNPGGSGTPDPVDAVTVTYHGKDGSNPFASLKVENLPTLTEGSKYIIQISKVSTAKNVAVGYAITELTPVKGTATVLVLDNKDGYKVTLYTFNGTKLAQVAVNGSTDAVIVTPAN